MKRRKRRGKRQVSPPKKAKKKPLPSPKKRGRGRIPKKRGHVWVRGPVGKSGRRKPGHFRKKPADKKKSTAKRKSKVSRKPVRKTRKRAIRSVGSEIRAQFEGVKTANEWVEYYPKAQTYHERYTIDPSKSNVEKFSEKYGDMPQHMAVSYIDENGELQHASTVLVGSDESDLTVRKMDELLSQYSKGGKIQQVVGFSLWVHDKLSVWQKRGLA